MTAEVVVEAVRGSLSPDVLHPAWRDRPGLTPSAGHCYAAAEAVYHLLGGKGSGWCPVQVLHEGVSHWFLRHTDGRIVDPTADQFASPPPYAAGRGRGFLTREPSARAATIIGRTGLRPPC